uniref:Nucleoprotein n=1 Tax=Viral hemorrhagic septicemia virus TaxID=11287 RepID=A0A5Q0QM62_9RHAB|nr:nucleoprotein [Viral hemorrhagic septicemia virus]
MEGGIRAAFSGLNDVRIDPTGGEGRVLVPGDVELIVYVGGFGEEDRKVIVDALSALGGPQTVQALSVLLSYVLQGNTQEDLETKCKVLTDMGFKVTQAVRATSIEAGIMMPMRELALTVNDDNLMEIVKGTLMTCSLLTKYSVDKMIKYITKKLGELADTQGVGELQHFTADKAAIRKLAGCVRPGQKITKALYAFILTEIADPTTQSRARAMGALRLNGTGMTMIGLFTQAANNLGIAPAKLLEDLCMESLVESARRIIQLMRQVSEAKSIQERYAIMMSRMLGESYYKSYGLNDNSKISYILSQISGKYAVDSLEGLEGIKVTEKFREFAELVAEVLVDKYERIGEDSTEVSDVIREAARQHARRTSAKPEPKARNFRSSTGRGKEQETGGSDDDDYPEDSD